LKRSVFLSSAVILLAFLALLIRCPGREAAEARRTARNIDIWMKSGTEALDTRGEPLLAASQFKRVLAKSPGHSLANLQLAVALDRAGKPEEARPYWERALAMAEATQDGQTASAARARLGIASPAAVAAPAPAPARQAPATVPAAPADVLVDIDGLMKRGMDLLYAGRDPASAAVLFRKVLESNPSHYGATYQLAYALDQAGSRAEARPLWERVLAMAHGYNDAATAATARARLDRRP
jgi:Tfp pilus assembly protein PilF